MLFAALLMSSVAAPEPARAHPHVWIDARVAVDMTEDGTVTALKVTWRLDELYTQTVIAGMDQNADGTYDPSELHPLVEEAVQNLEEWSYFTDVRSGTTRVTAGTPETYRAYMDADRLVYEFTLSLPDGTPPAGEDLRVRLFDPSYYISIALEKARPVTLDQAPDACAYRIEPAPGFKESLLLSESAFMQEAEPNTEGMGGTFAETVVITCG
ncbi:DUF1007 family protein [Caenispirillum salinarum]|uniref:DUF1007 family protein n=1 Tax=Caenispirillum salinarum TaxID=859058 RepID=UPI001360B15E|nr:DUF1007 family protein [Caenispirillum salinarum]